MFKYTDGFEEPYEDMGIREAGYLCSLSVQEAFNDERWNFINDSAFPLKIEFNNVKKLYNDLIAENAVKPIKKRRFGLGN